MVNLCKAPMFSLLTAEQLASVRQACVFGMMANEAIYVTHSNEVSDTRVVNVWIQFIQLVADSDHCRSVIQCA